MECGAFQSATLLSEEPALTVAFSLDGKALASGSWGNTIKLFVGDARQ